jgi:hypothetical protein
MEPQAYEPRRPPSPPVDPRTGASYRDGSSLLEQLLRTRVARIAGALPAKDVVELLLLPRNRASLARAAGYKSPAVAYNALKPLAEVREGSGRRHHPQRPFRQRYARELGCSLADLEHLIDTSAAEPDAAPARHPAPRADAPLTVRDGTSPLERRVVEKVGSSVQHLTASAVVRHLLWPQSPTAWAAAAGFSDSAVFNCLCWTNLMEYRPIRRTLSATLTARYAEDAVVVERALDVLIETPPAPWPPRPKRGRRPADAAQARLELG